MCEGTRSSIYALHGLWVNLENEHHELAAAIEAARSRGVEVAPMQARQACLLLKIGAIVNEIRQAPARTLEDCLSLLDVAFDHETDLAADMAFYGPADYPLIARVVRALAEQVPGFEFNSLRRWLSAPGQFEELMGQRQDGLCSRGQS